MAQNRTEQLSSDLADEVIKSGQRLFIKKWNIKEHPDEEIMVVVYYGKKANSELIEKSIKSFPVATMPKGEPCPCCRGTGRIG